MKHLKSKATNQKILLFIETFYSEKYLKNLAILELQLNIAQIWPNSPKCRNCK